MKIRLLPEAEKDIEIGAEFYEIQKEGLGAYFIDCLATDIDGLKTFGGIHEQYRGYFRALSKRFPFAIYFQLDADFVEVFAVLDARQDPGRIDEALGSQQSEK